MTTGICTNQVSFARRHGFKAVGIALLGFGLMLGGCNNKLKDENTSLRTENAELKDKVTATDSERNAMTQQISQLSSENQKLQMEIAVRNTPQPMPYPPERTPRDKHAPGGESVVRIAGDLLFASGSATLKPDAKKALDSHLGEIKSSSAVRIEGHTDSDPIRHIKAKYPTNEALSKARADAVKDYLVSKGVPRSKISTVGKGASEPLATKQESRRVDIVLGSD